MRFAECILITKAPETFRLNKGKNKCRTDYIGEVGTLEIGGIGNEVNYCFPLIRQALFVVSTSSSRARHDRTVRETMHTKALFT